MDITQAVAIIIRDKEGNYFIHQRNKNKKRFPNMFGIGAGGRIETGETKEEAAIRELFEETGITSDLKYLFQSIYSSSEFENKMEIFEILVENKKFKTNNGEWSWCGWVDQKELNNLAEENKLSPDTANFYKNYLEFVAN